MSGSATRVRLLIVDDHILFREGLERLLAAEPDLEVVGNCGTVDDALAALATRRPDLVLLDADLGSGRGVDFLSRARQQGFSGPVLVVTAGVSEAEAVRLLARGAAGIFRKDDSAQSLARGIRAVNEGKAWIDQRQLQALMASEAAPRAPAGRFSDRERAVMRGVLDGLANKEIAVRLGLSESSVKAVLQQIFERVGVRTRSQLVRIALERFPDLL